MRWMGWTAVAVLVGVGLVAPATAAGRPGSMRTAIVSLGDSFISGEGGRWLGNGSESSGTRSGTDRAAFDCDDWGCDYDPGRVYGRSAENECDRSDVAPIRSAPVDIDLRVNLACSGARLANVWPGADGGRGHFGEPPQIDRLDAVAERDDVRLVVLTVGANDAGFGHLVAGCVFDWLRSSAGDPALCHDDAQAAIEAALPVLERGLSRALTDVRTVMAGAGYGRADYRLLAMGYASPFPAGEWLRYPEDGVGRLSEGGCPVWDEDASWAAGEGIGAIVGAMRAAARAAGAEFLDLRRALDGHQLCDGRSRRVGAEGPAPESAEWVRRLSALQGSSRESLHPNAYGQRAIGACLGLHYLRPRGDYECTATPGRGYADGIRLQSLGPAQEGEGGAAVSSTRWPPGAIAWARGAPQCSLPGRVSKPCSCSRSKAASKSGTTSAMCPRSATVGCSSCMRWICVPSRSSQVNPFASVAGGSTRVKPSSSKNSTARSTSPVRSSIPTWCSIPARLGQRRRELTKLPQVRNVLSATVTRWKA